LGSDASIEGRLIYACEVTYVNVGYSCTKLKFFFHKTCIILGSLNKLLVNIIVIFLIKNKIVK
jgi:hypothetical protein